MRVLNAEGRRMAMGGAKVAAEAGQGGSALIEVLVAVVLLSVGMLSLLLTQTRAIQYERTAELRAIAAMHAANFADRMRANSLTVGKSVPPPPSVPNQRLKYYLHQAAYTGADNLNSSQPARLCTTEKCDAAQMAEFDVWEARRAVRNSLPGGDFYIEDLGGGRFTVWVLWQQLQLNEKEVDPANPSSSTPANLDSEISLDRLCPAGLTLSGTKKPQCLPLGVML